MKIQSKVDQTNAFVDHAASAAEGAIESSQQAAKHVVGELADQEQKTHDGLAPGLRQVADDAASIARQRAEAARATSRQIPARAEAISVRVAQLIQEQPLRSVLIAAATGAVAVALLALLRAPRS